ncbi:hypothetical protein HC766_03470, partial [Candidatus Gracilibacteria bacterium]|nr:hypothetical protein [Candidatus Gracilibacteria bacterium]
MNSKSDNRLYDKSQKQKSKSSLAKKLSGVYTFGNNKFNQVRDRVSYNKTESSQNTTKQAYKGDENFKGSNFLTGAINKVKSTATNIKNKPNSIVSLSKIIGDRTNPNSFSSVFNMDHEHIKGIKRVFENLLVFNFIIT